MAKRRPLQKSYTEDYVTFDTNLWLLAYFLGTTENYYGNQVKKLGEQLRRARSELPRVETELDELLQKMDTLKPSKAEEKQVDELSDKAYDLGDIDIFVPMDLRRFRQYTELLRILGLSYLVTIFEGYLVDIVRTILLTHPAALKSARQLTAEMILGLGERQQIVSYLAEIEVDELLYKSFPDVIKYFDKKFNINLNASRVVPEKIIEIMAARNIHVHNKGMVNKRYLDLVKDSNQKVGDYKLITPKYLRDSISSVHSLVKFIDNRVQRKYFSNSGATQK